MRHLLPSRLWVLLFAVSLLSGVRSPAKEKAPAKTGNKEAPRVIIHRDDAAVLVPSTLKPQATLYCLSKIDGRWGLRQTIDLTDRLDGWYTCILINDKDKSGNNDPRGFAMNDRWLAVGVRENCPWGKSEDYILTLYGILLFYKGEDGWTFHSKIGPPSYEIYSPVFGINYRLFLSDDNQLFVADPIHHEEGHLGVLYCFQLDPSSPPKLAQKILPPKSQRFDETSFGIGRFFTLVSDDILLVSEESGTLPFPPKSTLKGTSHLRSGGDWDDIYVFQKRGDQWEYTSSLLRALPKRAFEYDRDEKLVWPFNVEMIPKAVLHHDRLFVYDRSGKAPDLSARFWKFRIKEGKAVYAAKTDWEPIRADFDPLPQLPDTYTLKWLGLREEFCVVPPSKDGDSHFVPPKWTVFDADKDSFNGYMDACRGNTTPSARKAAGGQSQRSAALDRVPTFLCDDLTVCCCVHEDRIITTSDNPLCYDKSYRDLYDLEVWSCVNIYEIDPETGPKNVFRMTTSHNRDLEAAPVSEE